MKICVVSYKFGTEKEIGEHLGSYHYFIEKMRMLVRMGHEVFVIAPWLSFTRKGSTDVDGVKVLRYFPPFINRPFLLWLNKLLRAWYFWSTQKQVLKLDKRWPLAVVYVWQARETGYAIAKIKNQLRASFIFRQITAWQWHLDRTSEEIFAKRRWYKLFKSMGWQSFVDWLLDLILEKNLQRKFAQTIYAQADRIVFVSRAAILAEKGLGLGVQKTAVIGVGIEAGWFRPMGKQQELQRKLGIRGEKIVLFIGRLIFAEKGLGVLLEAMAMIREQLPGVNLVIIGGGGEWDRLQAVIKELKLENNVQCVGKKPFADLRLYLNAVDALVVPSLWVEAFGQVTVEAMACGVPVVTSDVGGLPETNLDGQTGFVVPAGDAGKLAQAMVRILLDPELKANLGERARLRVLENYTYEVLVNKFLEIINNARK